MGRAAIQPLATGRSVERRGSRGGVGMLEALYVVVRHVFHRAEGRNLALT
jgi:hypothetical protein